jgi:hypothetical protein
MHTLCTVLDLTEPLMPDSAPQGPDPFDDDDRWLTRWLVANVSLKDLVQLTVAVSRATGVRIGDRAPERRA